MQIVFNTEATPEEYYQMSKQFPFPKPTSCHNPNCKLQVPPKKHGFYQRNSLDGEFASKIFIRRYRCSYCGMTFSYLPSFCLPYYQYTLKIIFLTLLCSLNMEWRARDSIKTIMYEYPLLHLTRQQLKFYAKRLSKNINRIKLGLRQILPYQDLPPEKDEKEAQKILNIVTSRFSQIHTFSQRFFQQCRHSFMASC